MLTLGMLDGCSGNNTVLKFSWLLKQVHANPTARLGEDGVILGNGGASDGDTLFQNPFHAPNHPREC
eukprot:769382-Pleurochrysis_carterae.AAC.1